MPSLTPHAAVPAAGKQPHLRGPPPRRIRTRTHGEALARVNGLGELVSLPGAWLAWLEVENDFHRVRKVVGVRIGFPHLNHGGPAGDAGVRLTTHLNPASNHPLSACPRQRSLRAAGG